METAAEQCDVAVIGGGRAGSTAAALLARRGYRVMALEKAHHPRFHIGESLLPMNLPIFERLGVLEKVRALGVYKRGADFEADNERSEEHTSELQSQSNLVCRLLLEKKKKTRENKQTHGIQVHFLLGTKVITKMFLYS